MALYFVDYDLRKQRDYAKLYEALQNLGAVRVLESLWAFKYDGTSCIAIRDLLRNQIDSDDRLIISQVVDWASINAIQTPPSP
jgi:hypothetical protein